MWGKRGGKTTKVLRMEMNLCSNRWGGRLNGEEEKAAWLKPSPPPMASFARAHKDGGRPLFARRVTQEGEPTHSFSVESMDVTLIGMGCSLCARLSSASKSGM
jgi:hypothetical protein